MSMKKDFLEEVSVGDFVEILYGQQGIKVVGQVLALTVDLVRIQTETGSPRILLDSIISFDSFQNGSVSQPVQQPQPQPQFAAEDTISRKLIAQLENATAMDMKSIAHWETTKKQLLQTEENSNYFSIISGIISSFESIRSGNNVDKTQLEDKIYNIRAKVLNLIRQLDKDSYLYLDLYELLASMYLQLSDYVQAQKYFVLSRNFQGAFYMAQIKEDTAKQDEYLDEYLYSPWYAYDKYLYLLSAKSMLRRQNVSALVERIKYLQETPDECEAEEIELLCSCGCVICARAGLSMQWIASYDETTGIGSLKKLLDVLPEMWNKKFNHLDSVTFDKENGKSLNQTYTGQILNFNLEKCYGFIQYGKSSTIYFHLYQVNQEDNLRKILAYGKPALGLEVTFEIGKAFQIGKPPQAHRIRLTDRGAKEADNRLKNISAEQYTGETLEGSLTEYDCVQGYGKIYVDNTPYNVVENRIVDPYLHAYLRSAWKYNARVTFETGIRNGKNIALNVRFANEKDAISKYNLFDSISQKEVNEWTLWRQRLKEQNISDYNSVSNFYLMPYQELDAVDVLPEENTLVKSTTYQPPQFMDVQTVKPTASFKPIVELPPLEPLPKTRANIFEDLLPLGKNNYYMKAHKNMLDGSLVEAERLYICAIRSDEKIESAIADLVSVYLRDESKVEDAINLLETYGQVLPQEKRINMQLQIYQKAHGRAYRIKLCYVIEEAIQRPIPITTKLHYLGVQGNALRELGEYAMALRTSFQRWHQLYDMEVRNRGIGAVYNLSKTLTFIQRSEAICYYMSGDKAKARELAKELLRVSSTDLIADQIMNDTLQIESDIDQDNPYQTDEFEMESTEGKISNYAEKRMKEIKIENYIKKDVENGEFIGTIQSANIEINRLQNQTGKTSHIRSEYSFAIAKVIRSVRIRLKNNEPSSSLKTKFDLFTLPTENKYIARAIAAYGDYLIDGSMNQDTARYCYLQAMEVLSRKENDWNKSFDYYIESYFEGQQEMAEKVHNDNQSNNRKKLNITMLKKKSPRDIGEFLVGVLQMYQTLGSYYRDQREELVNIVYSNRYLDSFIDWLDRWKGEAGQSYDINAIKALLENGCQMLKEAEEQLQSLLEDLPEQMFSAVHSKRILEQLKKEELLRWLNHTDRKKMEKIYEILLDFCKYNTVRDFQSRNNRINSAIRQFGDLQNEIVEFPTQFCFDHILAILEKIRSSLQVEWERLYRDTKPEISMQLTPNVDPYANDENQVTVHLTIRNGTPQTKGDERQLADQLQISIPELSEGVEFLRYDAECSSYIYGNESQEAILVFRVRDHEIFDRRAFDATFKCSYSYYENIGVTKYEECIFKETITFRYGHHEAIDNPFSAHIGKEMEDESMFYGRQQIIDKLMGMLVTGGRCNYGMGILLYGQTRAGKTSIRLNFIRKIVQNPEYRDKMIIVDLGNINSEKISMFDFYSDLLYKLEVELKSHHPDVCDCLQEKDIQFPDDMKLMNEDIAYRCFSRFMDRVSTQIRLMDKMIVLLIDEFSAIYTAIREQRMPKNFMQIWKALLEKYKFFAVCFGQDDTPSFVDANENAFARMKLEKVTYLEEKPAKELMSQPIEIHKPDGTVSARYNEEALVMLYNLTAGSAYLIIKVCSLLVDYLNEKGGEYITTGFLRNFINNRMFSGNNCIDQKDFEPQINDRTYSEWRKDNHYLLRQIAQQTQEHNWAVIDELTLTELDLRPDQTPEKRCKELLERLEDRDVIEMRNKNECRIKVELLSEFLRREG